jgi:DNA uptake protein ComE-like DNA-binding protein
MGLADRDYMRNRTVPPSLLGRVKRFLSTGQGVLVTASAVVALGSGAIWLYRDARSLIGGDRSAEGTLVVNINTATHEQLETVPGIGSARAALIIAGRPYKSVDEIAKIQGISAGQVEGLRPFLTVAAHTSEH